MVLSNQDISLSYNILDLYYSYYTVLMKLIKKL